MSNIISKIKEKHFKEDSFAYLRKIHAFSGISVKNLLLIRDNKKKITEKENLALNNVLALGVHNND